MNLLEIKPEKSYVLIPDKIWDNTCEKPVTNKAVLIKNGVIDNTIPSSTVNNLSAHNLDIIPLPGITLIPGLIDCHVHFSMNSYDLFQAINDWENDPITIDKQVKTAALNYLRNGVIAVRDGGDKANIGLKTRNAVNSKKYAGPLITATGQAIYREGKYGSFLGIGINSIKEGIKQIKLLKESGIDQLKVIASGLVSFKNYGVVGSVQFNVDELTSIVEEAHCNGLKVMTHASSDEAVRTAVKAGVDSIEHGYFLSESTLEMMAEKGTAWVPTVAPIGNLVKEKHLPYEGADLDVLYRTHKTQISMLKKAFDMGVRLGIGTDAGANNVLHGQSLHQEIEYYSEAGLGNHEILCLATVSSSEVIGKADEIGTISAGKKPYLIGVSGNPVENLTALRYPKWVIKPF